ncbi:ATP-grasp domain-containing protein [Haloferax sp. DFSO52]|uniref:ATP-grasp domain-containing protein n=1 Tax=Haloferax sp. DFSO52 TaxID=3388505 RepID=UPI003A8B027D
MTLLETVRPSNRDGDVTVMVTGVGTPGASCIIRSLRQTDAFDARIVGVDDDPNAHGFSLVDAADSVPPSDSDRFIHEVKAVARREGVDVIFPLLTEEIQSLSVAKQSFEDDGIRVMVSNPRALSLTTDNGRLYDELVKQGHPVTPEFYVASTRDEFVEAVRALGYPESRVCFKRPVGSEMRGLRVLDPEFDRFSALMERKPGNTTTLEDVLPVLEETTEFPDLLVMEYLPGEEYSVDALAREDGDPILVSRSFTDTHDGRSSTSMVEKEPALIKSARELCEIFDLEYNLNFQFKYGSDWTPKLIEVNPHVSRSVAACVGAGANMPALGVQYALGRDLPDVDIEWGVHMTRCWQEVLYTPGKEPTSFSRCC